MLYYNDTYEYWRFKNFLGESETRPHSSPDPFCGQGESETPDKLFRPAESILLVLIIWILLEIVSNFVQQTPQQIVIQISAKNMVGTKCRLF